MLRKSYLSIQPKRIKNTGIFFLFANTIICTLIFSLVTMTAYAQGYYYGLTNSYSQPTTANYNATNSYYNSYTASPYLYSTNSNYQPTYSASSYYSPSNSTVSSSQPSYYSNTYSYSPNYAAATQGSYYTGNSTPSNTYSTGYTSQSSFYNPTNYGTSGGNYYSPSTSTSTYGSAAQGFYIPSAGYTGATGSLYTAPYTSNTSSYYTPATSTYTPATSTNSYYNNTYYRTAGSNTYYPAAQTYSPAATGYAYTTNATTVPGDVSGLYQGNWARNYSSTGAQTVGRTSNGGSMRSLYDIVRSSNSTSTTAGTCGGGGGGGNGNGGGLLPITVELTQSAASVNGSVTFFAENSTAKTIPVSGTIENGTVLNLSGTTAGDIADPALYGIKITATVKTNALQGAYTLTNTVTNTNIELGTFTANR
jgi:hypothetical protein